MGPVRNDPNVILARALDGLSVRQRVIANNVANVDTPNFKASRVRFEDALLHALGDEPGGRLRLVRTSADHLAAGGANPEDFTPQVIQMTNTTLRNDGNNVDIEREMAMLAETTLRFNAVSEMLARRFAMQRMIASDGRG